MNNSNVPPIIQFWLNGLKDSNSSVWQRDNYRVQIEGLRNVLSKELELHEKNLLDARKKRK